MAISTCSSSSEKSNIDICVDRFSFSTEVFFSSVLLSIVSIVPLVFNAAATVSISEGSSSLEAEIIFAARA
ncbi:MAG: hypothetical protein IIU94_03215, partial [Alistipes sp.]|nr:hypothetical protein [Alistipes sp.]